MFAQPFVEKKITVKRFSRPRRGVDALQRSKVSGIEKADGFFRGFSKETSEETSFSVSKRSSRINAANFFSCSFFREKFEQFVVICVASLGEFRLSFDRIQSIKK